MSGLFRASLAALILAGSSVAVGVSGWAQDESKPPMPVDDPPAAEQTTPADDASSTPAAPKTYPPYRRLPTYFGMVGVSDQQKFDIYTVRGRYRAEIYELERRIEELKRKEIAECEAILTEAQQKLLNQIRDAKQPRARTTGNDN